MKTNITILTLLFVLIAQTIVAQNLVPNPSFEDTTYSCPSAIWGSNLDLCKYWYNPNGTSSDYYKSCATGNAGVPSNMTGYQIARTGDAYCGIITNRLDTNNIGDWNEYIAVSLITPLIIGQAYEFKMYLNLADKSKNTISNMGALLTGSIVTPFSLGYINRSPQIMSSSNNYIIYDKQNWMEFRQVFVPDSAYQYLTIGNFNSTFNTSFYDTGSNSGWIPSDLPYILIDDVSLTPINTICSGDSISLQSKGDTLYAWAESSNPSVIISTDSVLTISPNINTIYYDYSNNDTTEFIVNIMQNGTLNLGNDTNLCFGQNLLLNASTSNSTYLWQDNSTDYKYNITQDGTYWVQITNSCGVFTDTINITYNTIPVNLGGNQSLCINQSLTLNPNIPNASYTWQDFSTNPNFTINPWFAQPNTYWIWVQVSDSNGCGSDTIFVDYNILLDENIIGNDTSLCDGDTLILNASLPNGSYLWSNNTTDSTIHITQTGIYWVQLTNSCYTDTDSINITIKPPPYFELGNDLILCNDEELVIGVNTIPNAIAWWNTSFTSTITIEKEGEYIATAAYQGCYFKDTINVTYEDCEISITIPNVFTPNADGINDFFSLKGLNINSINIKILNRWGQLIFESNDINDSWNGKTTESKDCPSGTYFYIIKAENKQKSKIFKGTVTLLK